MLTHLHVRNFALIEEADLEFDHGLNIITGETGAGKSILIDAVTAALGGKAGPGLIRRGCESAYVELSFHIDDQTRIDRLAEMDIEVEEGTLILSRRILKNRSVYKINDVTVTAATVRTVTMILIDIHGQHEHQSLMNSSHHLDILDSYAGDKVVHVKEALADRYKQYCALRKYLHSFSMDEKERIREIDFLRFEIHEIESAGLKEGEEDFLEQQFKRMSASRQLMESASNLEHILGYDTNSKGSGIGVLLSDALREALILTKYDPDSAGILAQIQDLESILSDAYYDLSHYKDGINCDEEALKETSQRLDQIRSLQAKYGKTYSQIMDYLKEKKARLQELQDYEKNLKEVTRSCKEAKAEVLRLCEELSRRRQEAARPLTQAIAASMKEMNFLQVSFEMEFKKSDHFTGNGYDETRFMLSTNPGQPLQPLSQIASGGELSRIMLAIKAVLADLDSVPTLIFDEIDTGISGMTAACVAEKLALISTGHQVLCITHLPQIACRASRHFMISKDCCDGITSTSIHMLHEDESVMELARLLGGMQITEAVLQNARELKELSCAS